MSKMPMGSAHSQVPAKLQLANALHQRGQLESARLIYEEILKVQPKHFDALHLSGVIAAQAKNPKRAVELINRAIKSNPNHAASHCNRGTALQELKQFSAALASYDRAIALKADYALAFCNRGNVLKELGRFDEALASYDQALAIKPDFAEVHFHRGNVLKALQQLDASLHSYDRAIEIKADYAEAHCNRGNVLYQQGQFDAARAAYERAIALKADYPEAHFNLAHLLRQSGEPAAALASFDRAVAIRCDYAEAHFNRGVVLKELQRLDEALASYDRAITIKRDFAEAHLSRAIAHLLRGDLTRGWHEYEWRWKNPGGPDGATERRFPQPLWIGKGPIAARTILVHSEQGLGDTLQFCRYTKLLADLGARVVLEAQAPLVALLGRLEGVSKIVARGDPLPPFDCHCPLLSLPLAFRTTLETIPSRIPYLRSDADKTARWEARLGAKSRPRIGLVWSGNPRQSNDDNRSIRLAEWAPLLSADFEWVSLQKEVREVDRGFLRDSPAILDFAGDLNDFGDTASLCECLDLVISVDTSVAHLSAAMGKRTWVLLSFNADWRWLLQRDDSPWYPTARLFRQRAAGDWPDVLERVGEAINAS
jgi:tetratricopeptide (TPR) repeat protein